MGGIVSELSENIAPMRYRAFISYSHTDARFAGWLHRHLEAWSAPGQPRLSPIFIDRAELAAGPDLPAQVRAALTGSAALIVVASPAARASGWVAQEICLFRELNPGRPVLAALLSGEPGAAFPEPLLVHHDQTLEPLAADFREGHDGKRLGLLKIVAGLTAQPLDRLVQRDAQSRQRRVMAVTAGAMLLSLILAAALIAALHARTEAQHQRAEAEGMVEFMLTDLRDKLKGVGRLDVMDTVNARAMAYYGDRADLSDLSPSSLQRRARVIEAMGEDDENRARIDQAYAKYAELHRVTEALLAKQPNDPDRIFDHAQAENRLALIETTKGNLAAAFPRFKNAMLLLDRLGNLPLKPEWLGLRSLVTGNLCAITLKSGGKPQEAVQFCRQAVALAQRQMQQPATNLSARYDLAFHYLWLGDAAAAAGDREQANRAGRDGLHMSEQLVASDRDNMFWLEQHAEVSLHLARVARELGNAEAARQLSAQAGLDAARLIGRDPQNMYWGKLHQNIVNFTKETRQ